MAVDYRIPAMPNLTGEQEYPDGILEELCRRAATQALDIAALAEGQGNPKGVNVMLLGVLVKARDIQCVDWETALRQCVKPQWVEANLRCLECGACA